MQYRGLLHSFMVCVLTSAAVLDNWCSDQITSFYAQIALKLLHLPSVIILDAFFSDFGRIGKDGKLNKTNKMQRRDADWHLLKKTEHKTNQARAMIEPDAVAPSSSVIRFVCMYDRLSV